MRMKEHFAIAVVVMGSKSLTCNILDTKIAKFHLQAGENMDDTNTEGSVVAGPYNAEKIHFLPNDDGTTVHKQP